MNGVHTLSLQTSTVRDVSPSPGLLGPIPRGIRRVSGGDSTPSTPLRSVGSLKNMAQSSPNPSPSAGTDNEPSNGMWSTAVGPATTTGKSGRVIERLMAENDRLKRELELQLLRVQDLEKSAQTYKPQIDGLREKVDSLTHTNTMDANLLARRDRRIEELKTDNAQLREGRETLQRRLREVERERDETQEQTQRDLQTMSESSKHATVHAEILETSHRQLSAEYRARREAWEHEMNALVDRQEQNAQRMSRLDVVCDQMRHENEKTKKLMADMVTVWEQYEKLMAAALSANNSSTEKLTAKNLEMEEVVDQMRWLMGLRRHTAFGTKPT